MSSEVRPEPSRRMIYQTPETRERILSVAQELFTERGLFDTQMKDVAAAVAISRTSLYRYFQDKQDLAMAILERLAVEMDPYGAEESPPSHRTGLERAIGILRRTWLAARYSRHVKYMAEFDAFFSGPRVPADFRERVARALHKGQAEPLTESIAEGIADGSIRSDIDPHLAAVTLLNAIRGLQQRILLRGNTLVELKEGDLDDMMEEALSYLTRGIAV